MKIRDYIEFGAVSALLAFCKRIPESWVFAVFRGIGVLSYYILSRRRITAFLNTGVVFPDMTKKERLRIVRKHFLYMAESLALNTLIKSGRISNEQLLEMVETDHWERLAHAAKTAPRGLLFISVHIGNWELMPQYIALRLQTPIHVIARKTDNMLLEKNILLPLRERFGVKIFYKTNAMMRIMQASRKGEPAGMMIDHKLNLRQGILNEFFGRKIGTTPTPAVLQIRFGVATLPLFMLQTGRRKYKMIIGEPVQWEDNGKPMEEQVAELTAIHQKIAEDIILEYPEQWFWVHDRWALWKHRKRR